MLVEEIMTKSVKTVKKETEMLDVVSLMCLYRISGLPVIDDENNLLGIIAEKDVLHNLFPSLEELMESLEIDYEKMMDKYVDVINLKVEDIMTKSAISIRPDLPCIKAASIMVKHKFRRIPVADDGKLVGMLSLGDVHKAIFQTTLFKGDKKLSFQVN